MGRRRPGETAPLDPPPVWSAPRVVPDFDTDVGSWVSWETPDGATLHGASYHDVDLAALSVTNLTLSPAVTVPAHWAADQTQPEGDWGWAMASVPLRAGVSNQLRFDARDFRRRFMG